MADKMQMPLLEVLSVAALAVHRSEKDLYKSLESSIRKAAKDKAQAARERSLCRRLSAALGKIDEGHALPLAVDSLTWSAVLLYAAAGGRDFHVYSELSFTSLGFLQVEGSDLRYVSRAEHVRVQARTHEFPQYGLPHGWLEQLDQMDSTPPTISFVEGTGDCLLLTLPRWEINGAVHAFLQPGWRGDLRIRLVYRSSPEETRVNDLGAARCRLTDDHTLKVALTGEQQLRLHAAHFEGAVLVLDAETGFAVSAVPALQEDAPAVTCRSGLCSAEQPASTLARIPVVLPEGLVSQLMKQHWWFNPLDSKTGGSNFLSWLSASVDMGAKS